MGFLEIPSGKVLDFLVSKRVGNLFYQHAVLILSVTGTVHIVSDAGGWLTRCVWAVKMQLQQVQ